MNDQCLAIGFVGAGRVHFGKNLPWAHASRLEKIGGVRVIGIVDPDTELAHRILREKLSSEGTSRYYTECQIFSQCSDLIRLKPDVVFIGAPPFYRGGLDNGLDMELQFVRAGIHTFVEKPLSVITFDRLDKYASEMKKAAEDTDVILSVGYMFRYHSAVDKMKELIAAHGKRVMACHLKFAYAYTKGSSAQWYDMSYSGGPINYQATHVCDLARYIVGEVDLDSINTLILPDNDLFGAGELSFMPNDGEKNIPPGKRFPRATMSHWKFTNGALGSLLHTVALPGNRHDISIEVQCDGLQMTLKKPVDEVSVLQVRDVKADDLNHEVEYCFRDNDCYFNELSAFITAVRTGNRKLVRSTYDDAAKTYGLTWRIRTSGEQSNAKSS